MSTQKQELSKEEIAEGIEKSKTNSNIEKVKGEQAKVLEKAPEFILTTSGVMIVNAEALGDKLTALLCETINLYPNSHVSSVIVRTDNFPGNDDGPVYAMAYADTGSIAINLVRCLTGAIEKVKKDETNTSFLTCLWANILSTFGHELDHLSMARMDRAEYEILRGSEEGNETLEEQAGDSAIRSIMKLATKFDVEIPAIAELGWFGPEIMKLFMKDDKWIELARLHADEGIIHDDGHDLINSFREYVKRSYPDSDDMDWEQSTTCVNINAYMVDGTREILKAEPVIAPKIDVVVKDVEPAEAPVQAVLIPAETFVGAGTVADEAIEIDFTEPSELEGVATEAVEIEFTDPAELAANAVITVSPEILAVVDTEVVAPADAVIQPLISDALPTEAPVPPVPEVVAAQAALDTTAAPPAPVETETPYEPHNLSDAAMAQVMEKIYKRLYTHIFTKCGWSVNPTTGRYWFTASTNVLEHIGIQDILDEFKAENFIKSYDTVNQVGQGYAGEDCVGTIRGFCSSKANLPCYNIYINIGGQRIKRSLIPQNPEKRNAENAYSDTAIQAQAGQAITWIMKGEAPKQGGTFAQRCAVKITTILNAGQPAWNYEVIV